MVIQRGSVWWVDLGEPRGSQPGLRRPALVISADTYNRSAIATVVVAVITSNMRLAAAPGNVALPRGAAGLPKASVINVTQIATIDKESLISLVGNLDNNTMQSVRVGLCRSLSL